MTTTPTMHPDEPPRGIRNNNPGNVRGNPTILWRGQSGVDADGFIVFRSAMFGLRAVAVIIRHYRDYLGLNTVAGIINRWAPPTQNPTAAYVAYVSGRLGVDPDEPINLDVCGVDLLRAIVRYENGYDPYSDEEVQDAIHLSHVQ